VLGREALDRVERRVRGHDAVGHFGHDQKNPSGLGS
jgi:hypothetical protein